MGKHAFDTQVKLHSVCNMFVFSRERAVHTHVGMASFDTTLLTTRRTNIKAVRIKILSMHWTWLLHVWHSILTNSQKAMQSEFHDLFPMNVTGTVPKSQ
ncbi:hypothetical protein EUGRSUZ_H03561 [Eucalyptus grandis]|uniref:Uncharacterized protein n=2 Tax=Eucalyptus grandis TaxID=71139 RepID=A0ACC3JUK6_EUCGR|nr:hypothetical protein EUGRSUZ_H03561 [Eucalyptus grandis]